MRLHHWVPVLLLAVGYWPRARAVDVGESEESAASCPNVTTVFTPSSSNATSVEVTDASTCKSSVAKVTTSSEGVTTLDLRHYDIAAVKGLPHVDVVRLDNNQLRSFTAVSNISELFLANNSIPTINEFEFPEALTLLDLTNNALGDIDGAALPSSLQYLNLSGNPIGSLSNVSFPSSLLQLDVVGSSVAALENFSFPSSVTTLNFSNNPITIIRGVIFPDSLAELTLIATANSAAGGTTTLTASVVTPEEARALQTTATDSAPQTTSVLEEFEVRQSDADRFEKLTLWEVSTTSTLSCSDSKANPRYVQDTMLCVLSDSEFADKYKSVILAASSGSVSGSMWGTDTSSSHAVERIALKETLHQRRSWFLIGAAALLSAFTILMFVNTFCMCLRRRVRGGKTKDGQPAIAKTASGRSNNFWHESTSMEPDDEVRHLLCSDPPSTDENSSQPEPELTVEAEDSPAKRGTRNDPLLRLQQELPRSEIDGSLVKHRELLATTSLEQNDPPESDSWASSSQFIYFKAAYRGKTVVLKTLSIANRVGRKGGKRDNTVLAELCGFVEEIRLSATLSHPQLVAFYGFLKMTHCAERSDAERVALVMEYMGKGDLNTFIQTHKRALQQQKTERTSRNNSLDKRAGWHDESDDDFDEDVLQSEEEDNTTDSRGRWNWRNSSADFKSKLSIATEVAQAVQYLHSFSHPLFHGNLSSQKVFLDSNWNVKLGDLTCCSALRRWSSSHKQNKIGSLPSTTGSSARFSGRSNTSSQNAGEEVHMDMTVWTAPEVLDGRQYTQKADIYSFGVLLSQLATYECTSAEHSVMDDTEVPMLNTHKGHASGDGEAPTPVRLLMFRCQAFQPEARPTADELLQELHQIKHELMEKLSR
ncbi:hypothetical protein PR003_g13521 [Phytophthora rubi]|uniref:Protein kinase domain-containing protein n=1 Tax=Phytophthora rubi TaxID=129364 RepID=A0A6A3M3E4_9STRA|nr:hypothetical protein PR002_g12509 [Phytophthora rubi]KAE9022884.1 hypothetical protein PR001_g13041 [Phytophthora rubi]KAE9334440.1 hypothetical protein PR003_g13521 [Phytophthora rubi]